ncbi:MAG: AEC family transporter [Sedimenticola sp.]
MLASAFAIDLPQPVDRLLEMLAGAAAPVALVALGASLSLGVLRKTKAEMVTISWLKLIVHPTLVAVMFLLWPGQEKVWIQAAILCACLPIAANVFVLSDHYGAYQSKSATAIMASTVLATLTVPVILYALFLSFN